MKVTSVPLDSLHMAGSRCDWLLLLSAILTVYETSGSAPEERARKRMEWECKINIAFGSKSVLFLYLAVCSSLKF